MGILSVLHSKGHIRVLAKCAVGHDGEGLFSFALIIIADRVMIISVFNLKEIKLLSKLKV